MLLSQKSNPQLHQNLVNRNFFQNLINPIIQDEAEADYELIFSDSSGDTLLEFKKLSQTEVSVDELVDNINESLS